MSEGQTPPASTGSGPHPGQTIAEWWNTRGWPWAKRVLLAFAYSLLVGVALSILAAIAVLQLFLLLTLQRANDELIGFSRQLIAYVRDCLSYIALASEEMPFPARPFPSA